MLENLSCSKLQGTWSLYLKKEIKNDYPVSLFVNVSALQIKHKWQVLMYHFISAESLLVENGGADRPDLGAHQGQGKPRAWAPPAQPASWGTQGSGRDQQCPSPSPAGRQRVWSKGGKDWALWSDFFHYVSKQGCTQTAPAALSGLQKHPLARDHSISIYTWETICSLFVKMCI